MEKIHRSKSRETVSRPLPDIVSRLVSKDNSDGEGEEEEDILTFVTEEISTSDLQEFDQTPRKGKRSKNKKGGSIQRDLEDLQLESSGEEEEKDTLFIKLQNDLLTAVKSGNNKMLEDLVQTSQSSV